MRSNHEILTQHSTIANVQEMINTVEIVPVPKSYFLAYLRLRLSHLKFKYKYAKQCQDHGNYLRQDCGIPELTFIQRLGLAFKSLISNN